MKKFYILVVLMLVGALNLQGDQKVHSYKSTEIKAIIFDCDGTLIDSEYAHYFAWKQTLEKQGHDLDIEQFHLFVGKGDQFVAHCFAEKKCFACAQTLIEDKKHYYYLLRAQGIPPIETTVNFVHRLAKEKNRLGLKLGVASGARKEEILENLRHLGIEKYFDIILSGVDDLMDYHDPEGTNKPKPYIYLQVAKLLNLSPEQCIAIEDSYTGVTAAVDAGFITIAVPNYFTRKQDLSRATVKIESFGNLSVDEFLHEVAKHSRSHAFSQ